MNKRSVAAMKAAETRRARKRFMEKYPRTAKVAHMLMKGYDPEDVVFALNVKRTTVAAVQANLHREGQFSDMAFACNYR